MLRLKNAAVCSPTAWASLASAPTTGSPSRKPTTDGVSSAPAASAITVAEPSDRTVATAEYVVPRSIPIVLIVELSTWRVVTT